MAPTKRGPSVAATVNPTRIANAKQLRTAFSEKRHAPDGLDPNPLTVPRCVECAHCGWPVWPRDAKVATRKTYERAGIERGGTPGDKKKEKKEATAQGGEGKDGALLPELGEEEEEEDDADSLDTVERMQEQLNDAEEKVVELTGINETLEKEKIELTERLEETEKQLEEAEERIDFLEASELRWREKCSKLRVTNADLRHLVDRKTAKIGDLETDVIKRLEELRILREEMALFKRRRVLMLRGMEGKLSAIEEADWLSVIIQFWRRRVVAERERRNLQEIEARRRKEVAELQEVFISERARVTALEATTAKLRASLKAAGHKLLLRALGTSVWPQALGHGLHAWSAVQPLVATENKLERTVEKLKETREALAAEQEKTLALEDECAQLTATLEEVTEERNSAQKQIEHLLKTVESLGGKLKGEKSELARMAEERAKAAQKELEQKIRMECGEELRAAREQWDGEREGLEDEIACLDAKLEGAKRGAGIGAVSDKNDLTRVVPKGQGVLCVGCLKQLVHRSVNPLPPVAALKEAAVTPKPEVLKNRQRSFFRKELDGMPDVDDAIHSYVWKARRDPFGAAKHADASGVVKYRLGVSDPPWPSARSASVGKLSPLKQMWKPAFR